MSGVEVIRAEVLAVPHGFLGRRGGVSTGELAGLNVGLTVAWLWVARQISTAHRRRTV